MDSAKTLFELLDVFKDVSGLKINCTKTEGMWIGASKENKTKPFGIKWPTEPINALGLYFTYDLKLLKEKNFIERLDSIKKLINIWSSRGLSISGKVTIIKSFLIPKFVYVCSLLSTPNEMVKRYLQHQLKTFGGLFFFNCNYDVNDYTITSQFYRELLLWWSQFRETFATDLN